MSEEESVATCPVKSLFEGFFAQLVPCINSRRKNQESIDQLWIISKASKAFYKDKTVQVDGHM